MPWDLLCYRIMVWTLEKAFDLPMYWTGVSNALCMPIGPIDSCAILCGVVDNICKTLTTETDFLKEADFTRRAKV